MAKSTVSGLRLAQALTLAQISRVVGASFLVALGMGLFHASFAIPAGVGDLLVGLTAPLAFIALRRGSLMGWVGGIVWNVLGLTDLVYAVTEGSISGASGFNTPLSVGFPWVLIPTVGVPIFTIVHLVTLALLVRRPVRVYFAGRETLTGTSGP